MLPVLVCVCGKITGFVIQEFFDYYIAKHSSQNQMNQLNEWVNQNVCGPFKLNKIKYASHLVQHLWSFLMEKENKVNMGLKKAWEKDFQKRL